MAPFSSLFFIYYICLLHSSFPSVYTLISVQLSRTSTSSSWLSFSISNVGSQLRSTQPQFIYSNVLSHLCIAMNLVTSLLVRDFLLFYKCLFCVRWVFLLLLLLDFLKVKCDLELICLGVTWTMLPFFKILIFTLSQTLKVPLLQPCLTYIFCFV